MIVVQYKSKSCYHSDFIHNLNLFYWSNWIDLGYFENLTEAVNALVEKRYTLIVEDELTYKDECFYFRFYDKITKKFIPLKSPWEVGLNDCTTNSSTR